MNKLLAIEVFVQVVDAGGFTRAAELMQLPKATVSTMVAALETSLSVKLLHRTTRNVTVTAEGAAYYERCLHILSYVRDADDSLLHDRVTPHGRLRVDVPTGIANSLIIPALPDFFRRYPDIALELGCGDRPVDLVEEGVDCAIRGGALPSSNLAARTVGVMKFMTCAAPSYLAEHGMPQHPRDLAQHRCISFFSAKTGRVREWDFARDGETFVFGQPSNMAINDANGYMCAGLSGLGIMQAGAYEAVRHIEAGTLVAVLPDWSTRPLPINVVYPQNRHLAAKVRVFIDWTAELFASSPRFQDV
ncbi:MULTISPECIES: LysR family transcriptional regulator [Massilia]|uniref:Transcriptional regulator n=1 Tax=Massilia aurea TaxID=373040 RepID=A0A422QJU2_9BURK|nr:MULTISPECIES: LysR family transcriptional regulator [Massilia]MDY0963088.1 LysR family transcriptional regulator [Massilia sp. CFBP9026]RNF30236.1 transcriptional regulator [Massilia aurea]